MATKKARAAPFSGGTLPLTEDERVFIHMVIKHGVQQAASTLNKNAKELGDLMKRRPVQRYLHGYNNEFIKQMARWEVNQITKFPVGRADVISRALALALMPPNETKGDIEGQVKALEMIAEIMGMKFTPRDADHFFKDKTPEQLDDFARYGIFNPSEAEKLKIDEAAIARQHGEP
jgi:hypothetical protein